MSNYIETAFMQQRTDFMKTLPDRRKRFSIPDGVDMYLDIEYVNDQNEAHRLDVFRPSESPDKELPIIFNVHGGGLIMGCKEFNRYFCARLCKLGYVVFSIEYRLVPEYTFYHQCTDFFQALRYVQDYGNLYYGKTDEIYGVGDSGGAMLLTYCAAMQNNAENTLTVSLDNFPPITKTTECELQVTVGNVLYHWKRALITKDSQIIIESRPKINNRRKYPRADLSNTCSITIANTSADGIAPLPIDATMDNISANGFAFLTKDPFFTDHKGADIHVTIHDFDLPNHNELTGHVIRCSNNEGMYIVGCQMPEDDFFIRDYVKQLLAEQADDISQVVSAE